MTDVWPHCQHPRTPENTCKNAYARRDYHRRAEERRALRAAAGAMTFSERVRLRRRVEAELKQARKEMRAARLAEYEGLL